MKLACAAASVACLLAAASPTGPRSEPADAQSAGGLAAAVERAAAASGLPEPLILSVISAESGGDPGAVSRAGAMGLMQLMPRTWEMLRARLGLGDDPFDVFDNVLAGAIYLRDLRQRFGAPGFLAAYNAGPRRYEEHLAGRPLPAETRAYLAKLAPIGGGSRAPEAPDWRASPLFPEPQ